MFRRVPVGPATASLREGRVPEAVPVRAREAGPPGRAGRPAGGGPPPGFFTRRALMPLLDHFHPPPHPRHHWESFHSNWATRLADELNERWLPPEFMAEE